MAVAMEMTLTSLIAAQSNQLQPCKHLPRISHHVTCRIERKIPHLCLSLLHLRQPCHLNPPKSRGQVS